MKRLLMIMAAVATFLGAMAAQKASFPGGEDAMNKYLAANIVYPAAAKANGVEGVVVVIAVVNPDGTLGTLKIQRMIDPDLEQEAIRVVKKMPKWTPATDDSGTPVSSTADIPVVFELSAADE